MSQIPITVFGKPECVQCTRTVKTLEKAGLEEGRDFRYRDVTTDSAARDYVMQDLGYNAAPVVVLDDEDHWYGFRPDHLKRAVSWALASRELDQAPMLQPAVESSRQAFVLTATGPEPPTVTATSAAQLEHARRLERQALDRLADELRQDHGADRVAIREHSPDSRDVQLRHDGDRAVTLTAEYPWRAHDDGVDFTVRSTDASLTPSSGTREQHAANAKVARELVASQRSSWGPERETPSTAPVLDLSARIERSRATTADLTALAAVVGTALSAAAGGAGVAAHAAAPSISTTAERTARSPRL